MEEKPAIRILILDRGYILACRCLHPTNYAMWIPVTDSRTIRVWGTTEGLGQLVHGPVGTATKLDAMIPEETIPVKAVIRVIEVSQAKWAPHLRSASRKGAVDATTR